MHAGHKFCALIFTAVIFQLVFALQLYSDWLFVIGFKVGAIKTKPLVFVQAVFHSAPPCSPRQQLSRLSAENSKRQLPFLTYLSRPAEKLLNFCR